MTTATLNQNIQDYPENKFAECLFLKANPGPPKSNLANIYFTLNFNTQFFEKNYSEYTICLSSGQLLLEVTNGTVTYGNRAMTSRFPEKTLDASRKEIVSDDNEQNNSSSFEIEGSLVSTKGSEKSPSWVFECEIGNKNKCLIYSIIDKKLCTVQIDDYPCCINLKFKVHKKDIIVKDLELKFPLNLSKNIAAVLKHRIKKDIFESFSPYISMDYVKYEKE